MKREWVVGLVKKLRNANKRGVGGCGCSGINGLQCNNQFDWVVMLIPCVILI